MALRIEKFISRGAGLYPGAHLKDEKELYEFTD